MASLSSLHSAETASGSIVSRDFLDGFERMYSPGWLYSLVPDSSAEEWIGTPPQDILRMEGALRSRTHLGRTG
jgi:hypothetical protein